MGQFAKWPLAWGGPGGICAGHGGGMVAEGTERGVGWGRGSGQVKNTETPGQSPHGPGPPARRPSIVEACG